MKRQKSRARVDFTIWVNGKKVQVGAQVGTMVTIASEGRVIGLSPTVSSSKRISVALLELKSDKDSVAKGKQISRVNVAFGRIASFPPTGKMKIRFSARLSLAESLLPVLKPLLKPQAAAGKCCRNINPGGSPIIVCASCYLIHGSVRCCTGFVCCLQMGLEIVFGSVTLG